MACFWVRGMGQGQAILDEHYPYTTCRREGWWYILLSHCSSIIFLSLAVFDEGVHFMIVFGVAGWGGGEDKKRRFGLGASWVVGRSCFWD